MIKNQTELLQKYFNDKEFCILTMYDYMNKIFFNNYFHIDEESLAFFFKYFKTEDRKLFPNIWGEKSVQKDIFIFCEDLYKHFNQHHITSKEIFFKELEASLQHSLIRSIFPFYYNDLYNFYLVLNEKKLSRNYHSYKDENFRIHYFKNVSSIELREVHSPQDLTFFIILDGLIKYDNYLFGNREVIFSNTPSLERKFKLVTPNCSIVIFSLKKEFLSKTGIPVSGKKFGTFKLYTLKIFDIILNYESITSTNYIKLFQIGIYLNERTYYNKINVLNIKYLGYKKLILNLVRKNIFFSEKEITERLLLELDVSVSKLYKIFMKLFFTTPNKYIEGIKIAKTYYLLANTNEKVETICEKVGYSTKAFKEKFTTKTGYSPTVFRNLTRERGL